MLLSQRNLKNPQFSQELRYSPETELINNFDKKSQFRFDCKNTTFCEHHKYKQKTTMLWLYDHIMQVFDHLSIFHQRNKTRTKIAYEYKAKRKLKQTKLKFPNEQNHKRKVTAKQLFKLFYLFSNRNK